jgi:hypothetical protein
MPDDLEVAARHLTSATAIVTEVGARNEIAKALVLQAELSRRRGDPEGARKLLDRALGIFEDLGTLDEPARVRAALERLTP